MVERPAVAVAEDERIGQGVPSPSRLLIGAVAAQHGERLGESDEIAAFHRPDLGLPIGAEHGKPAGDERLHALVVKDIAVLRPHDTGTHGTRDYLPALAEREPVRGVVKKDAFEGVGKELPPAVGSEVGSEYERVRHHGGKAVTADDGIAFVKAELRII